MRRRDLVKSSAAAAALGVTGCLHDGEEPGGDGGGDGGVGRTDSGEESGFSWTFKITGLNAGDDVDEADVEFLPDDDSVVVDGTIYGSDLCKTAELESAALASDMGEGSSSLLDVGVATRDEEGAGDMCAQSIREIEYTAEFTFDDEIPDQVHVTHDGRTVSEAELEEERAPEGNEG